MGAPVLIRPAEAGDLSFMLDSAWRSMRAHPATDMLAPHQVGELLAPLLAGWETLVAADPDYPQVILSWLCFRDHKTVAWAYTKPHHRKRGALRSLAAVAGLEREFDMPFPSTVRFVQWRPRWRPFLVLT